MAAATEQACVAPEIMNIEGHVTTGKEIYRLNLHSMMYFTTGRKGHVTVEDVKTPEDVSANGLKKPSRIAHPDVVSISATAEGAPGTAARTILLPFVARV